MTRLALIATLLTACTTLSPHEPRYAPLPPEPTTAPLSTPLPTPTALVVPTASPSADLPSDCWIYKESTPDGWEVITVGCPGWRIEVAADGTVSATRVP